MKAHGQRGIGDRLRDAANRWRPADRRSKARSQRRDGAIIGVDVADRRSRGHNRNLVPLLVTALAVGLALAALRIDLLRIRYALAESIAQERSLLDQKRSLTARMRTLRDPVVLARRAEGLGFARPEQLIDLPLSTASLVAGANEDASVLASVSAPPPTESVRR